MNSDLKKSGKDLTKGSILRNLITLSMPIMLSNFFQTLYNLTDTFWLGKLGEHARGAVSAAGIAYPLVFFVSAFSTGFAVAATALVARFKGAGEFSNVRKTVAQLSYILILLVLLFLIIGLSSIDWLVKFLKTPVEIQASTEGYLKYIFIGLGFMFVFVVFQSLLHGLGDTILPMKILLVSILANLLLDPFLIFGIGIFPRLETEGAGIATLISRIVAALMVVYYVVKKYRHLLPRPNEMLLDKNLMKTIISISIPASLAQSMSSLGFLVLQGFVNTFGTVVISVYSIGNRMIGFFMMPAMGVGNALTAIIGQNLGAGNIRRAEKSFLTAVFIIMLIMTIGAIFLYSFGASMIRIFINDPEVIKAGSRMFKISSFASWAFGFLFIFNGVYGGAGKTLPPMFINIGRLWLLRIPLTYLLAGEFCFEFLNPAREFLIKKVFTSVSVYAYDSLWWSMLISNFICAAIAICILRKGSWKYAKIKYMEKK